MGRSRSNPEEAYGHCVGILFTYTYPIVRIQKYMNKIYEGSADAYMHGRSIHQGIIAECGGSTAWVGAGVSSSGSSMNDGVILFPERTIDDEAAWEARGPDDWWRGDWIVFVTPR